MAQPVRPPERAPYLGVPPTRVPTRVEDTTATNGRRVVLSTPEGFFYDARAIGAPFRDQRGILRVMVITEAEWYAMQADEKASLPDTAQLYPASLVYVE